MKMVMQSCQPSLPRAAHLHLNPLFPPTRPHRHSPHPLSRAVQVRVHRETSLLCIPACQPSLTSNILDARFLTSSRPGVRMWSLVWLGVVVSGWEEDRIPVSCPYSLSPRR